MISVIIPTCDRAPVLDRCLRALRDVKGIEGCEVIVVDDGSADSTPQVIARHAESFPVLRPLRQENQGPGRARNAGMALAGGDVFLFLDDDVFASPGLLEAHVALLDAGADVSQGRLEWHPELAGSPVLRFMDRHGMQFVQEGYAHGLPVSFLHVYTANLCVRADVLRSVRFDDAFAAKRYAFEDTALAYRLHCAGAKLLFNAAAHALHYHPIDETQLVARERKVGYASQILTSSYPEIAVAAGMRAFSLFDLLQAGVLAGLMGLGMDACAGFELRLRLRCREAFLRGALDYTLEQRRKGGSA